MKVSKYSLIVIILAFIPGILFAHARFANNGKLKLRNMSDGNKSGPCGPGARSATPTVLNGGQDLEISWEETIQHPGYYKISFSPANDEGFENNVLAIVQDTQDSSANLPHSYKQTVKVPNIPCENCSIQLIQVMTENPANPSLYYSCADIKIVANESLPTPSPTPSVSDQTKQDCD